MPTPRTTSRTDIAGALDVLAAAAEQAPDDAPTRAVLAVVVQRLEDAAGAGLGTTSTDPLVLLQRRFGRAHARLAARPAAVDVELLHGLTRALEPVAAGAARPATGPAAVAALAGC